MPQSNSNIDDIKNAFELAQNYTMTYIRNDYYTLFEIYDFEIFWEYNLYGNNIPFAALINTNLKLNNRNKQAVTCFTKYSNLSIVDNILNRPGIFAIKEEELRLSKSKGILSKDNWKIFIDNTRAIKVAQKIV